MNIGKKIVQLRESQGLTQALLAEKIDINRSVLNRIELGTRPIRDNEISSIAQFFNVTTDYLLGNDGTQQKSTRPAYIKRIPVLGTVRGGIPTMAIEEWEDWEEIDTRTSPFRSGEFFALRVTGRSMEPTLCEGDIVIVRQQQTINSGEIGIVMVNGNEATVKEVKESSDGITLIGHNTAVFSPAFYTRQEIEELPIRIIGKVVELRRKF